MYETAMLKPFKLKTTNGDMTAYYGNCKINITSVPFDNLKNRNQSATPFDVNTSGYYDNVQNTVRLDTTTHVIVLPVSVLGDSYDEIEINVSNENYNVSNVGRVPDLNNTATFTFLENFVNSIKDNKLKRTWLAILYNITHGNTPYSNAAFQPLSIQNSYALQYDVTPLNRLNTFYPTGANNYPQNALIFIRQDYRGEYVDLEYPCFFYQKDTDCRYINLDGVYKRIPCYGISIAGSDAFYFYWTTYKGV